MDIIGRHEELALERAGFDSRRGAKVFDYQIGSYRYFCGECQEEITPSTKPVGANVHADCVCGWRTIEFKKVE